ncbi:uncharacterized protein K02A2.6-like [Vanessa tameamea]|uniref:RNA-directed DNA polymerase n=1 Tax=Vanessa tameamea TaxID=334116 RepID=A0A8B8I5W8_VANTA
MGCIVWGYRVVISSTLKNILLKELHSSHMGIVEMKAMARSVMWWPGIDADIESTCRSCSTCSEVSTAPSRAALQPWPYTSEPWFILHLDFLGPFHGKTFLVLIYSTSKWLESFQMQRTTAGAVVKVLRETFARFGLPREVVSDHGPPFSSSEYKDFMNNNGIKGGYDLDAVLQSYLLDYRNVEHSTTGVAPATLLQKRRLHSRLDLLRSDVRIENKVQAAQMKQIAQAGGSNGSFNLGD